MLFSKNTLLVLKRSFESDLFRVDVMNQAKVFIPNFADTYAVDLRKGEMKSRQKEREREREREREKTNELKQKVPQDKKKRCERGKMKK